MKTIGHGYTWNDLEVGFKFRTLNRTITESDLVGFVNATGMLEMIFIDQTFEHEGGIKGGRVVPAALPYCLMEGLLCQTVQQMTGLALLEIEKKVLKPTFVGDTVQLAGLLHRLRRAPACGGRSHTSRTALVSVHDISLQ